MIIQTSNHPLVESLPAPRQQQLSALRNWLLQQSAVVVALAAEQLADRAEAITGVSPAIAPSLRQEAR